MSLHWVIPGLLGLLTLTFSLPSLEFEGRHFFFCEMSYLWCPQQFLRFPNVLLDHKMSGIPNLLCEHENLAVKDLELLFPFY